MEFYVLKTEQIQDNRTGLWKSRGLGVGERTRHHVVEEGYETTSSAAIQGREKHGLGLMDL